MIYCGAYFFGNNAIDAAKKVTLAQIVYLGTSSKVDPAEFDAKVRKLAAHFNLHENREMYDVLSGNSHVSKVSLTEKNYSPDIKIVTYSFDVDGAGHVEMDFFVADKKFLPGLGSNIFSRISAKFLTVNDLRVYADGEEVDKRLPEIRGGHSMSSNDRALLDAVIGFYGVDHDKAVSNIRRLISAAPPSPKKLIEAIKGKIALHPKKEGLLACFQYGSNSLDSLAQEIAEVDKKPVEVTDYESIYRSCKIVVENDDSPWTPPVENFTGDVEGVMYVSKDYIVIFQKDQSTEFPDGYFVAQDDPLAAKLLTLCQDAAPCVLKNAEVTKDVRVAVVRRLSQEFDRLSDYAIDWLQIKGVPQ